MALTLITHTLTLSGLMLTEGLDPSKLLELIMDLLENNKSVSLSFTSFLTICNVWLSKINSQIRELMNKKHDRGCNKVVCLE